MKGSEKPKKPQKKAPQKTLKGAPRRKARRREEVGLYAACSRAAGSSGYHACAGGPYGSRNSSTASSIRPVSYFAAASVGLTRSTTIGSPTRTSTRGKPILNLPGRRARSLPTMQTGTIVAPFASAELRAPRYQRRLGEGQARSLREDPEHFAVFEQLGGPAHRLPVAGAARNRERAELLHHPPHRRIAPELRFRHVANRPRGRQAEQPRIDQRLVVRSEDHRARRRDLLCPAHVDAVEAREEKAKTDQLEHPIEDRVLHSLMLSRSGSRQRPFGHQHMDQTATNRGQRRSSGAGGRRAPYGASSHPPATQLGTVTGKAGRMTFRKRVTAPTPTLTSSRDLTPKRRVAKQELPQHGPGRAPKA